MTWAEICDDKALRDLPFEVETNGRGQIIMSPHSAGHSHLQAEIQITLNGLLSGGRAVPELAVQTGDGVRVVDVAWVTREHFESEREQGNPAYLSAPAICVEVVSPANSDQEMTHKRDLYFAKGAREVWFCSEAGDLLFFAPEGPIDRSALCPGFPVKLVL